MSNRGAAKTEQLASGRHVRPSLMKTDPKEFAEMFERCEAIASDTDAMWAVYGGTDQDVLKKYLPGRKEVTTYDLLKAIRCAAGAMRGGRWPKGHALQAAGLASSLSLSLGWLKEVVYGDLEGLTWHFAADDAEVRDALSRVASDSSLPASQVTARLAHDFFAAVARRRKGLSVKVAPLPPGAPVRRAD